MKTCDDLARTSKLLPLADAKEQMFGALTPIDDIETVALPDALGRFLAQDIYSPMDVPPFDNSAMDGYAFHSDSLANESSLSVIGKSFAGTPFEGSVTVGECVRIMTGAKLPNGCNTVVMQENCSVNGDVILVDGQAKPNQNIRQCGEEFNHGQRVLAKGEQITPRHVALLASLGFSTLSVMRKLKVAIFSTGDELVALGQTLSDGQIYDSNRFALVAMLEKLAVEVIDLGVIADDPQLIKETFITADEQADVVISSGGVSVGEADFTRDIIEELGNITFWKLAIKPGKPLAFGHFDNSVFFGLPGNPVSAMVTFYQLAKPALVKLGGGIVTPPLRVTAQLTHDLRKAVGRLDFQRGIVSHDKLGKLQVTSTGLQSSSMMGSMCLANCFIVLEQEQGNVAAGEDVTIELFDSGLL